MTHFSRLKKNKSNDILRRQVLMRIHYSKPFSTTLAFTLTMLLIILSSLTSESAALDVTVANNNTSFNSSDGSISSNNSSYIGYLSNSGKNIILDLVNNPVPLSLWNSPPSNSNGWIALFDCDQPSTASTVLTAITQSLSNNPPPKAIVFDNGSCLPTNVQNSTDQVPIFETEKSENLINMLNQTLFIPNRTSAQPNDKVLYAVSGVVLGLFFIVVVTNVIKNRLRPSRTGIAVSVYLFSLGGVNAVGTANESEKEPKDEIDIEKDDDGLRYMAVPAPEDYESEETAKVSSVNEINTTNVENSSKTGSISTLSGSALSNHVTEEQLTCPICLGDFESGEELRVLPCHHQYHTSCIDPWLLDISPLCPMCKADFTTWNIDVSAQQGSVDDPSISTTSVNSSAATEIPQQQSPIDSDAISQISSIDDSPHAFPHFRWIKYLTAIRRAGGRRNRRRSRRPNARNSAQSRIQRQHQRQQSSDTAGGSGGVVDLSLNRASM
ncbi:9399_t:CDS:2 [Ambispora leptoticha]|uniref:9399_t:CDS:1 n=1 Tax=Ambispora leptoticha TaxID=144679 RepID=A0A9N8WIS5_9GLOM|nr:9399_t:CDS:2 [Ambispora leptoticha]